jgi:hypothetical protein
MGILWGPDEVCNDTVLSAALGPHRGLTARGETPEINDHDPPDCRVDARHVPSRCTIERGRDDLRGRLVPESGYTGIT